MRSGKPTLLLWDKFHDFYFTVVGLATSCTLTNQTRSFIYASLNFQLRDAFNHGDRQKRTDLCTLRGVDPRVALLTEMTYPATCFFHPLKRQRVYTTLIRRLASKGLEHALVPALSLHSVESPGIRAPESLLAGPL